VTALALGLVVWLSGCNNRCGDNERSEDGACVRLCNSNFDCAGGEACVEGACRTRSAGGSSSSGAVGSSQGATLGSSTSPGSSLVSGTSNVSSTSATSGSSAALSSSAGSSATSAVTSLSGVSASSSSAAGTSASSGPSSSAPSSSAPSSSAPSSSAPSSSAPATSTVAVSSSSVGASSVGASSSSGGCVVGPNQNQANAAVMQLGQDLDVVLCAPNGNVDYYWVVPAITDVGARARFSVEFANGSTASDWDFHLGSWLASEPRSLLVEGSCARGQGRDETCTVQLVEPGPLIIRAYGGNVVSEGVRMRLDPAPRPDGGQDLCETTLGNHTIMGAVALGMATTITLCATYYLDQYFSAGTLTAGQEHRVTLRYPNGGGYALFDVVPGLADSNGMFVPGTITSGDCSVFGQDDDCTFTLDQDGALLLRITTYPWADPQVVEITVGPPT